MRFLALVVLLLLGGCAMNITLTVNGNGNTITINPVVSPMGTFTIPVSALPGGLPSLPGGL